MENGGKTKQSNGVDIARDVWENSLETRRQQKFTTSAIWENAFGSESDRTEQLFEAKYNNAYLKTEKMC